MIEVTNLIAVFWMIGTGILWTGISWATVKVTQRNFENRQNAMDRSMKRLADTITCLEHRVAEDEKNYITRTDCDHEQVECEKHRDYHENQLIAKLDGLQAFMVTMDAKRENTRTQLSEQLSVISQELAVLKRDINK